ncbi:MAG: L-rhamnose mutarotase [Planctomycetales bacterium]|nr:L-rhamnose mutarotase [Planctomycetales bacterium]
MHLRISSAALLLCAPATLAFSPYEAYLMSGKDTHVGLLVEVQPDKREPFNESAKQCQTEAVRTRLSQAGISRLKFFSRTIDGKEYAVAYFLFSGSKQYLSAAEAFEHATGAVQWKASTTPHTRAARYGRHWLQMEWINFVHGLDVEREPTSSLIIGTTVRPEKEREYRTLHQTVWPGVVDQIVRGNIRNLNVFLVELDDKLVEFLYLEYMGQDQQADDQANQQDPINQRWWKLTDACQQPFSDVTEGNWVELSRVD